MFLGFQQSPPPLFVIDNTRDQATVRRLLPDKGFPGSILIIFQVGRTPSTLQPDFEFLKNVAVNAFDVDTASACFTRILDAGCYSLSKDEKIIHHIVSKCLDTPYPMSFASIAEQVCLHNLRLGDFMNTRSIMEALPDLKKVLEPAVAELKSEERLLLFLSALLTNNQTGIKAELFHQPPENKPY